MSIAPRSESQTLRAPGPLVQPEWLAANLHHPAVRVFDATKYLPNEGKDGAAEFSRAHLPGAGWFDLDLFADPQTDLPHMAPSQGRFAQLAGEAGIGPDSIVIFYDQKGQSSAARGWWLLRLFGLHTVCLLDGGLPAWRRAGLPISSGPPLPAQAALFAASFHARRIAGLGDVWQSLARGDTLILDARPADRFTGAAPEPRPGLAQGHIPGSRSLPAADLLDAEGCFLPLETVRERLARQGAGQRPVITTCGTGVTACILAFALHLAGLPDAAVYDGSWAEWGGRPDTPKAATPHWADTDQEAGE